jgi:uncharacterized protein (UPF0332 family)
MMNQECIDIARYRLEKARKIYDDAVRLYDNKSFESAVNRLYYAMFHSVNALLICKEVSFAKHSAVKAFFAREFIKTHIIDHRFGVLFSDIFDKRQRADYQDFVEFKEEDVKLWVQKVREFIKEIEHVVMKEIN